MRNHIALVGFMASGKSTVGKRIARKLKLPFVDIDDAIEEEHGPIADIFYGPGEAAFRRFEQAAVERALQGEPSIIALGGGAVTHEPTAKLLKKQAYRVFIKVPAEEIAARLRKSSRVRPLLGPHPSFSKLKQLYERRMPLYAHCDHTVEAAELGAGAVVDDIVQWMNKKRIRL